MFDVNSKYFIKYKEDVPRWLLEYKKGDSINFKEVFKHKALFYPGSGVDDNPIRILNKTRMVHTYIYTDYLFSKERVIDGFTNNFHNGYYLYDIKEFSYKDLKIDKWISHYELTRENKIRMPHNIVSPFGLILVFERKENDYNLPERFVVIYMGSDSIAAYDGLFQNYNNLFALVVNDYSFGGNYDYFGYDGALYKVAKAINKFPHFIICESNTYNWPNYETIYMEDEIPNNNRSRYLSVKKEN